MTTANETARYQVTGYSDGIWCIVDTTKFLDDEQRRNNWPMHVREWGTFSERADAQRVADQMNLEPPQPPKEKR